MFLSTKLAYNDPPTVDIGLLLLLCFSYFCLLLC